MPLECSYSLDDLANRLSARLEGGKDSSKVIVSSLASLQNATIGQLTFLSKPVFARFLETTKASAVLVNDSFVADKNISVPLLRVKNAYLAYAQASALFDSRSRPTSGIHTSAIIDASASIAKSASIGAYVVIGPRVKIGDNTVIAAGSVIADDTTIGANCYINSNVTVYHRVVIGDRVLIHSGAVIGADGFGFAPKPEGGWQKIHQLGCARIGNDVEIGANTTIDRGAIEDTIIEDGVIIDNQVQIAHNVRIGKNTAIAACVGIAGSTTIGAHCTIGGAVGVIGHITIADSVHITAMTLVTGSIKEAGSYSGGTGVSSTAEWKRNAVRFNQLDELAKRVKELEGKFPS